MLSHYRAGPVLIEYDTPMSTAAKHQNKSGNRIGIYLRISQDREGEAETVERHGKECRALARRLGGTIVDTYIDNDTEASSGKPRPQYLRLLDDINAGRIDIVVAWHNDRLIRRPVELEHYIDVCQPKAVPTHYVQAAPVDLTTASGRMVARQLGVMARYEIEHMIERLQSQQAEAAANGEWMGGTRPFGWGVPTGATRKDGTPIYDMYQVVPEEAAEVLRLTRAVLAGESLGSLVKDLNARGVQTTGTHKRRKDGTRQPGHPPWSYATLRQVLTRKRNIGLLEYHGETFPGKWPAIVPEDEYDAVVKILADPTRRLSLSNATKWLGAGIYRCGREGCGALLKSGYVGNRDGTRRRIYRCDADYRPRHNGAGPKRGGHVHRNAEPIDALVAGGEINGEPFDGMVVRRLQRKDAAKLLRPPRHSPKTDTAALRAERDLIRTEKLPELDDMWASNQLDRFRHDRLLKRFEDRLVEINNALTPASTDPALRKLLEAADPAKAWPSLTLEEQRRIVNAIMTVTVLPLGRGFHSRIFDPATVKIEFTASR